MASTHFRNQINLLYESTFAKFKELAEATWPTLQVVELIGEGLSQGSPLELMIRNHEFVGELVSWVMACRCGFRQCGLSQVARFRDINLG